MTKARVPELATLELATKHQISLLPGAVRRLEEACAQSQMVSKALRHEAKRSQSWRHRKTG